MSLSSDSFRCPTCRSFFAESQILEHFALCDVSPNKTLTPQKLQDKPLLPRKAPSVGEGPSLQPMQQHSAHRQKEQTALSISGAENVSEADFIREQMDILKRIELEKINESASQKMAEKLDAEQKRIQKRREESNTIRCMICKRVVEFAEATYLQACPHLVCHGCLKHHVDSAIQRNSDSDITCPVPQCGKNLDKSDCLVVVSAREYEEYLSSRSLVTIMQRDIIKCPQKECGASFERVTNTNIEPFKNTERDEKGALLSEVAYIHRETCRFRCPYCQNDFCSSCFAHPYHLGYTCDEVEARSQRIPCHFCKEPLPEGAIKADVNVCQSAECAQYAADMCRKKLPCGHICGGIRNSPCLPCMEVDCPSSKENGTEFCPICFVDDLLGAPCIQLECGHIIHYHCVKKRLEKKWTSSRITFNYCECPTCKRKFSHPSLAGLIRESDSLKAKIEEKALTRLKHEGLEKCDEVMNPQSRFHGKPLDYAMHRYSYSMCFKCKNPYFAGQAQCAAGIEDHNPEELVCAACSSAGGQQLECPRHGTDFIQFKCRYCCNVASWFCFGNTHYCEPCHRRAYEVKELPRDKLPKCTCKIKHPPQGEEFSLGCSLCREQQGV